MKTIKIVYYTGTGGTAQAAEALSRAFARQGCQVETLQLRHGAADAGGAHDLLVILFAVHAFNAPLPVYQWLEAAPAVQGTPAVVVSVSGGGEVVPNTACRQGVIRRLERVGYEVVYEHMLVMPSNWIVPTPEPVALKLLEVLPERADRMAAAVLAGERRRRTPYLIDRFFSWLGELEKAQARIFGRRIRVSEACTGCGWCAAHCPAGNITMAGSRPAFGPGCQLCLNCLYGCPVKALTPGIGGFVVLREGYDLKALARKLPLQAEGDVAAQARGVLWSGVRQYLRSTDGGR